MTTDFVVKDDAGFGSQLKNLAAKLPGYMNILEISQQDAIEAINTSAYYNWVQEQALAMAERRKNWTSYRSLLRNPGAGTPPASAAPETLVVPPPPPSVALGVEAWFRKLAKRIKGARGYTDAIGQDLGIVTAADNAERLVGRKPQYSIELVAGQPLIKWTKGDMDGVEIWKDSGDGNFALLVVDLRPNHLDTSPLPAPGATAVWKYKLIYRFKDARIGAWSDVAAVTVAGTV